MKTFADFMRRYWFQPDSPGRFVAAGLTEAANIGISRLALPANPSSSELLAFWIWIVVSGAFIWLAAGAIWVRLRR